jgi:excisionase family DNA binding protein
MGQYLKRSDNLGQNSDMPDDLMTPEAAAEYLKMHVDSVRRLLRQKKLPGVKIGGAWRIKRAVLDALLEGPAPAGKAKKKPAAKGK